MLRSRVTTVALVLILIASCGSESAYEADVLKFSSADTFILTTDGGEHTVQLEGVDAPEQGGCLYDESVEAAASALGGGQRVDVTVVGQVNGTEAVTIENWSSEDVAIELVRSGVAVPTTRESGWPPEMREARDEALEQGRGFFDEEKECTFAAALALTEEKLDRAVSDGTSVSGDAAGAAVVALVSALEAVEQFRVWMETARHDMTMVAFPASTLAWRLDELKVLELNGRKVLKKARAASRNYEDAQAQKARDEVERQRKVKRLADSREQVRRYTPPPASTGSSGSSGGGSGYTGPRCYAPGGKTWRPC